MLFSVIKLSSVISWSAVLFILFIEITTTGSSPLIVVLTVAVGKFLKKSVLDLNSDSLFDVASFFEFENSVFKSWATLLSFLDSCEVAFSFLKNVILKIFANTTKANPE